MFSVVCENKIREDWSPASPAQWGSSRMKLIVRSMLAAESSQLAIAQDHNQFARVAAAYTFGFAPATKKHDWHSLLALVPDLLVVDAKSLFDMLQKAGSLPSEKRIAVDLLAVREALERPQDTLQWIPTKWMLADSSTKDMKEHDAVDMLLREAAIHSCRTS